MRLNMLVVDQAAVDELDDWVEKVLKEANPNYLKRSRDFFGERGIEISRETIRY